MQRCSLCRIELTAEQISFTCSHNLCNNCLPYLILNQLITCNFKDDYFNPKDAITKYPCLICNEGISYISYDNFAFANKSNDDLVFEQICECCEKKTAIKHCIECNQNFCNKCLKEHHNINKKCQNHSLVSPDEKMKILESKKRLQCVCGSNFILTKFCESCKTAICQYCSLVDHANHSQMELATMITENQDNYNGLQSQKILTKYLDEFDGFQKDSMKTLENMKNSYNMEFESLIDQIIVLLDILKQKNMKKSLKEYDIIKNQMKSIHSSISYILEEMTRFELLPPNKVYHLSQFFSKKNQNFNIIKFQTQIDQNQTLKDFRKNLFELSEDKSRGFYELLEENIEKKILEDNNDVLFNNQRISQFLTDPVKLLNTKEIFLDEKTFYSSFLKSHVSCSFILNDESYLVWGGKYYGDSEYCISVLNLNSRKKEIIASKSIVHVLNVHPKENNKENTKKILYCGDSAGVLRIFDVTNKNFNEINRIETNSNNSDTIISTILFEDKFNEISIENNKIYALITFNNPNLSIKLFNLEGKIIKEIPNPYNQCCASMDYYYDDHKKITCIFLGFSFSYVAFYNLTTNEIIKKFESVNYVTSINFIFKKREDLEIDKYLIFTQQKYDKIIIGDLNKGTIHSELQLPDVTYIYDLCLWNDEYYILAASGEKLSHFIIIVSFDILKPEKSINVLKTITSQNSIPINLIKILVKNNNLRGEVKECLISFQINGNSNKIIMFQ